MKRKMIVWSIAVAGLLLCAESVQAQSRVVRRSRTERRDERQTHRDEPRRPIRTDEFVAKPRPIKVVDNDVIRAFEHESFDSDRLRMADMIFSTDGHMTVDQITRISLSFDFDTNRIKFLKKAYLNCVDRHNYYRVLRTLEFSSSRENVIKFVTDNQKERKRDREPDVYYKVTSSEMSDIIKALKNESYDSYRAKLASMIVCGNMLTSRQIADMAKTFSYDSYRTDFLLLAYDNCVDPQNYVVAVNTLQYSSNRDSLMRKISRRP